MTITPDDGSSTYPSLASALAAKSIPLENQVLIREFCEYIGIDRYEDRGYIKAVRANRGPALQIHWGWTNGFESEDEARRSTGDRAPCWPSQRGTGLWGVSHPTNNIGHGGGGPANELPDYGTCPSCNITLPATGVCDTCS
jgi:hypothetical protein